MVKDLHFLIFLIKFLKICSVISKEFDYGNLRNKDIDMILIRW